MMRASKTGRNHPDKVAITMGNWGFALASLAAAMTAPLAAGVFFWLDSHPGAPWLGIILGAWLLAPLVGIGSLVTLLLAKRRVAHSLIAPPEAVYRIAVGLTIAVIGAVTWAMVFVVMAVSSATSISVPDV